MSRPSLPTPCPAGLRRFSIDNTTTTDENTENIEYTRAIQPMQPRRRSMMFSKPASKAPPKRNNNLEDLREEEELCLSQQRPMAEMKKTLLGKPAQRMAVRKQDISRPEVEPVQQDRPQRERRTSSVFVGVQERDIRRRTMFIPDDTTILTIHPGANTTHRLDDTFQLGLADLTLDPVGEDSAIKKPMRRPRKSLAAAPKRIPLGQVHGNSIGFSYDGPGAETGKENQSPERPSDLGKMKCSKAPLGESRVTATRPSIVKRQSIAPRPSIAPRQSMGGAVRPPAQVPRPRASLNPRVAIARKSASPPTMKLSNMRSQPGTLPHHTQLAQTSRPMHQQARPPVTRRSPPQPPSISLKDTISARRDEMQIAKINQYPVLSNNLSHPELYEDKWLSHQEVALTHIVNEIFSRAGIDKHRAPESHEVLRSSMIRLYDHPDVALLHQHLHASVQFGALKPSPSSDYAPDVVRDIGLRKRFINLFVKNYDEGILRAAMEVVVGRQMPTSTRRSVEGDLKQGESILDPHADRRALIGFLETFFIECADAEKDAAEMSREKKTLQRSMMLVWLLDHAKCAGTVPGLLFRTSATLKSSSAVVQELGRILLPTTPDVLKALKLMGFVISHAQLPLDEVVYQIDNLAVDLRDGIFLTKLVELALCSSYQPTSDDLRVPCIGHASKIHNVQIALTRLHDANMRKGVTLVDVVPSDIVDGHRERTLMLIWHIVSQYGLSQLVDWRELCADIRRAGGDVDTPTGAFSKEDQEVLLQSWAAVHAIKHNIEISNLTTSFAKGQAYAAILSAFTATTGNLERKLQALAFPITWTKYLLTTLNIVPNRVTTLSNLAFLASRLLPLSRRTRAASVIQRAFRAKQSRTVVSQRVALMRVARDCATVVRAQQQVVGAAIVLQRAWRGVIASRVSRLEKDVEIFQAVARGWLARRDGSQENVMGGW